MMNILDKVQHLEHEAAEFGLQWETAEQIMVQIRNECIEVEEHLHAPAQKGQLQDEVGDLLHAVFSLCVFCNLSPQDTLQKSLNKFEGRLNSMKEIAKEQGLSHLQGKSFAELMHYWDEAKLRTKAS